MYSDKSSDKISSGGTLEEWVMSKCQDWREHYESNYAEKHEEYYRLWRGIWSGSDAMRESERSRLIAPALQQAVEDGLITQEQADGINQMGPRGNFGGSPRGNFGGGHRGNFGDGHRGNFGGGHRGASFGPGAGIGPMAVDQEVMHEAIADALGISEEEFETAIAEGKNITLLAEELGVA